MVSCYECGAALKYPVYINNVAYGSDCASKKFGIRIPEGCNDATKIVEAKITYDLDLKSHYELFEQNKEWLSTLQEAMKRVRSYDSYKYNFLLSIANQIGAINFSDCTDMNKPFYLSSFNLDVLSNKQRRLLDKIL